MAPNLFRVIFKSYHPQTNSVERVNRVAGAAIRCYIKNSNHRYWDVHLPKIGFALRGDDHGDSSTDEWFLSLYAWEREYDVWVISCMRYECGEWMSTTFFPTLDNLIFFPITTCARNKPWFWQFLLDPDAIFSSFWRLLPDFDTLFSILAFNSRPMSISRQRFHVLLMKDVFVRHSLNL